MWNIDFRLSIATGDLDLTTLLRYVLFSSKTPIGSRPHILIWNMRRVLLIVARVSGTRPFASAFLFDCAYDGVPRNLFPHLLCDGNSKSDIRTAVL